MEFREIRHKFLDYFRAQGHEIVPSSSLIPREDPTLLFTNAGMVQFKRLFLGEEKKAYTRAATSQKCVRAGGKHNDLDNVGYTARHHTFFEMLGNFSFGDYFKREAIGWAWELLTAGYGLPADRLYVSVFTEDDEAYGIWEKEIGIPPERIVRLGEKDNFWAMGDTGPCGPCSEILIDRGEAFSCGKPQCGPGCDCDRYLEIWNLVFTQFDRTGDGRLAPLPRPNIDTGMGLERLSAVVQGVGSNYETDLFRSLLDCIRDLSAKRYGDDRKQDISFRVIADHSRAAAFLIGDGVMPSNEGRGYVLRRIIRRAIRFGQAIGLQEPFLHRVADKVVDSMGVDYGELLSARGFIQGVVLNEEKRFSDTLQYGMKILWENIEALRDKKIDAIPGDLAFKLYDTYGLSLDIVADVAREEGLHVETTGYETAMARQKKKSQESWKGSGEEDVPEAYRRLKAAGISTKFIGYETTRSQSEVRALFAGGKETRTARAGDDVEIILDRTPFYGEAGGQVGDRGWIRKEGTELKITNTLRFGEDILIHYGQCERGTLSIGDKIEAVVDGERRKATARNHTATHLLHTVLRELLGEHVKQAGSFVGPERLRFDFSHFSQLSPERLKEVESLVNRYIRENLPLATEEMSREEASTTGAIAIFEEKYGEKVRVVRVAGGVSMELCGGTHTGRTGDIGLFKIISESAIGANLRRMEALTGDAALAWVQSQEDEIKSTAMMLKVSPDQVRDKVERLLREQKQREREIEALKARLLSNRSDDILSDLKEVNGVKLLVKEVEAGSPKELREFTDRLKDRIPSGIIVLGARRDEKALLICVVTRDLSERFKAGDIIGRLSRMVGGKGGGRPDMAQGGGNRPEELSHALDSVHELFDLLDGQR